MRYHVKELVNLVTFGLISRKFVKHKKQTNEQKYQANKQTNRKKPQTPNPKLRIEIKVILN